MTTPAYNTSVRLISMRNRLIHGYFDVNLDVVWKTVKEDLPELLRKLDS